MAQRDENGIEVNRSRCGAWTIRIMPAAVAAILSALLAVGGTRGLDVLRPIQAQGEATTQQANIDQRQDKALGDLCLEDKDQRGSYQMLSDDFHELRRAQSVSEQRFIEIDRRLTGIEGSQRDILQELKSLGRQGGRGP